MSRFAVSLQTHETKTGELEDESKKCTEFDRNTEMKKTSESMRKELGLSNGLAKNFLELMNV